MPFYAVGKGIIPGVYHTWAECEAQVKGFSSAKFQKFSTQEDAEAFVAIHTSQSQPSQSQHHQKSSTSLPMDRERSRDYNSISNLPPPSIYLKKRLIVTPTTTTTAPAPAPALPHSQLVTILNAPISTIRSQLQYQSALDQARCNHSIIIHTDGGAVPNPGPCASGVVIEYPLFSLDEHLIRISSQNDLISTNSQPTNQENTSTHSYEVKIHKFSVAYGVGTNNWGEIQAITHAFQYLYKLHQDPTIDFTLKNRPIILLSDSDLALKIITGEYRNTKYKEESHLVPNYWDVVDQYKEMGALGDITLYHVSSHAGFEYNEMADQLVHEGVKESIMMKRRREVSRVGVQLNLNVSRLTLASPNYAAKCE